MIELSVIRDLVAIFGVIAGFSYYVLTVQNAQRNQKKQLETRQAQLFMPLFETYRNKEFRRQVREIQDQKWEDHNDFMEKYGPVNNPDAFSSRVAVSSYFDGIGVLLKKNLLDINMVNDLIGNSIISVWEKIGTMLIKTRERTQNPFIYNDFEYLYLEIYNYREQNPRELAT